VSHRSHPLRAAVAARHRGLRRVSVLTWAAVVASVFGTVSVAAVARAATTESKPTATPAAGTVQSPSALPDASPGRGGLAIVPLHVPGPPHRATASATVRHHSPTLASTSPEAGTQTHTRSGTSTHSSGSSSSGASSATTTTHHQPAAPAPQPKQSAAPPVVHKSAAPTPPTTPPASPSTQPVATSSAS
jgi:hypothetical protein